MALPGTILVTFRLVCFCKDRTYFKLLILFCTIVMEYLQGLYCATKKDQEMSKEIYKEIAKEELFENTDSTIGCFAKKQMDMNELKNLSKEQEMECNDTPSNIQKDEIEFVQNNLNKCRNDKPNFQYEHVKNLRHKPLSNMKCQQKTFHKTIRRLWYHQYMM